MADKGYKDELQRAFARSDADKMIKQLDTYIEYFAAGCGNWHEDDSDDFMDIHTCHHDDPEKALAYVVLGASRTDDPKFLGYLGCGPLEARKSARFRWLLSNPFQVAVSEQAWEAIKDFRITGPHEEPSDDTLPPRHVN
jgi:hypothetical protein